MNYRPRKGVVLVKICDAHLLIPDRQASEFCKGIEVLTVFETLVWKQFEKGKTTEETIKLLSAFLPKDKDKAANKVREVSEKLSDRGFLEEIGKQK